MYYGPWGHTESDMTEGTDHAPTVFMNLSHIYTLLNSFLIFSCLTSTYSFLKFLINLFMVLLDLCFFGWAFSSCSKLGLLFISINGLLTAVASFVVGHRL